MARTAEISNDGTPLDCSTCTLVGCPERVISNVRYTRRASRMLGSTSYLSQFSETLRRTASTYQAKRLPKSPPVPVKPNPPFALGVLNVPYGPLTGPPWPKGTTLLGSGSGSTGRVGCCTLACFFGAGLRLLSFSGIGIASGSSAFGLGRVCDRPKAEEPEAI